MTESPAANPSTPAPNRLSIAHLLLWTAMTAIVLGFIRHIAPHYTPTSATTPQLALNFRLQYLLLFAISPAFGAALAGLQLAIWRGLTQRFGFPSQPGHWLLVILAAIPLAVAASWPFLLSGNHEGIITAIALSDLIVMAALSLAAAVLIRRPTRWLLTFALATGGFAGIALSLTLIITAGAAPLPIAVLSAVLGGISVASSILAGLAAGILDLTAPERFDVFHWTGIATLAAIAASPLVARLIAAATIG